MGCSSPRNNCTQEESVQSQHGEVPPLTGEYIYGEPTWAMAHLDVCGWPCLLHVSGWRFRTIVHSRTHTGATVSENCMR